MKTTKHQPYKAARNLLWLGIWSEWTCLREMRPGSLRHPDLPGKRVNRFAEFKLEA